LYSPSEVTLPELLSSLHHPRSRPRHCAQSPPPVRSWPRGGAASTARWRATPSLPLPLKKQPPAHPPALSPPRSSSAVSRPPPSRRPAAPSPTMRHPRTCGRTPARAPRARPQELRAPLHAPPQALRARARSSELCSVRRRGRRPLRGAAVAGRRPQRGAAVSGRSPGAELRTLLCSPPRGAAVAAAILYVGPPSPAVVLNAGPPSPARARLLAVVVAWWVKEVRGSVAAAYASVHKQKRPPQAFPTMQPGPPFFTSEA
jgi:hypothetical protein